MSRDGHSQSLTSPIFNSLYVKRLHIRANLVCSTHLKNYCKKRNLQIKCMMGKGRGKVSNNAHLFTRYTTFGNKSRIRQIIKKNIHQPRISWFKPRIKKPVLSCSAIFLRESIYTFFRKRKCEWAYVCLRGCMWMHEKR